MKTKTIRKLGKGLTAICLVLLSYASFSQTAGTAVLMSVQNMVQLNTTSFQYDVVVTNTGTTTMALRGYSWGINPLTGFTNGTVSHSFLSRDASLASIPAVSASYVNSQIRATTTNAAAGNEVVMALGVPVRIGTCKVITTTNFGNGASNYNPFPASNAVQVSTASGKTQCVVTAYVPYPGATSYTINGPTNAASGTNLNVLTGTMTPSPGGATPFLLNAVSCTPVITNINQTSCNSYTWACTGTTYTASGTYACATAQAGNPTCFDTTYLHLTINNSTTNGNATVTACNSYTWNGTTYTASGTYTFTSLNAQGCVNTATLNLTINNSTTNGSATVTACDSYTWNGTTYTASGTYTFTSLNAQGCTNTATLNLTINHSTTSSQSATACDSYTWSCNGTTYTASGAYTCTSLNAQGCTNTATLNLTINNSSTNGNATVTACDSYTWNGVTYNASGIYTYTSLNAQGCVNTATLNLTINHSSAHTTTATACDSYTWACNGTTYTASGSYTCTSLNAQGCVHTETLSLTINHSTTSSQSATACDSYTWSCNGTTYTTSGAYTCTSLNAQGCTNTATLNLTVNYSTTSTQNTSACDSYTWSCNGVTYTASGSYTCTSVNAQGCTNTATLNLTINHSTTSSQNASACDSYMWSCNGNTYTTSGTYTCTSLNAQGCVNIATLNLNITPSSTSTNSATACDSYTWPVNGVTYTTSGSYSVVSGCHTDVLNLTINLSTSNTTSATAAGSYTWAVNGVTYFASGTYTVTSLNASGCLHTEILNLVITGTACSFTLSVIEDQPISCWHNNDASLQATASPSGTYTYTCVHPTAASSSNTTGYFDHLEPGTHTVYVSDGTCITSGTIFFLEPDPLDLTLVTDSMVSCLGNDGQATAVITGGTNVLQGYLTWWTRIGSPDTLNDVLTNNFALTLSGLIPGFYNVSIEDDHGCFYNETNPIDVAPPIVVNVAFNPIICHNGSTVVTPVGTGGVSYPPAYASTLTYEINGMPVAASYAAGTYTITATDYKGCTGSNVFTITNPSLVTGSSSATACDSYTWNGTVYTVSGSYVGTFVDMNGCDSIHTLNLTINYSTHNGDATVTACDSYTWNGTTYTTSGTYTYTSLNVVGCTNTATLYLTINYSTTNGNATVTACDSYTWNGTTYTTSGTYTYTSLNAAGCTNTATLSLTINYSTTNGNATVTACDSYTWNGTTYTTSGTYTYTSLNAAGCTNTATLTLTINYSSTVTTSVTACDSYMWPFNGVTYTTSGTYTAMGTNTSGCPETHILNLTINYSTTDGNATVTACDSYTWNGTTYTTSGTYTYTSMNAAGCTNTATLTLTINYSTTNGNATVTACDSYTWNGTTYTASGTYTYTSLNAAGCTNTATLTLTINYSTTNGGSTTTQCNSYTWNGTTYTASGTYTYTTLNAAGCVNTATLHLTIKYATSSTTNITACNSYTWTNGVTYTAAGVYSYTTVNAAGCDSILTLHLTLNNGVSVSLKAMLEGSYDGNTGLMKDSLRRVTHCPSAQIGIPGVCPPVNVIPGTRLKWFNNVSCPNDADTSIGGGNAVIANNIMSVSGNNAIVDWVFVEVRDGSNYNTVVATKYALIQRDGDIVSCIDGTSPLYFSCVCPGNYYLTVKHRNHLGVMTGTPITLGAATASFDFSNPSSNVWVKPGYPTTITNTPRHTVGSIATMWGGDANTNKNSKYNGVANDKEQILYDFGVSSNTNDILYQVYKNSDLNMDGKVKYNNSDNDKNWLLNLILVSTSPSTPNVIISQHTPN